MPEVAELVHGAGLEVVSFVNEADYDPTQLRSPALPPLLVKRIESMPWLERLALGEQMDGSIAHHTFYVKPRGHRVGLERRLAGERGGPAGGR